MKGISGEQKEGNGDDSRLPPRIHQEDLRGAGQVESESTSLASRASQPEASEKGKIGGLPSAR